MRRGSEDAAERRARLNRRLRIAFLAGVEEWAQGDGRPLTADELERVLRHYPGDVRC